MSWRYKDHVEAKFGINNEELKDCPERVTRIDFAKWEVFYNGDPDNWIVHENSNYESGTHPYRLPVYKKDRYNKDGKYHKYDYIYIKFLTADDYARYIAYVDRLEKNGEDAENLREIEALAAHIGKIADERLREVQKRTQKAIDDNRKLMEETRLRITKENERQIKIDEQGRFMWS